MTPKELAPQLTGREIGDETTPEIEAAAKAAGLVIVFGASDDLMEFRGAINEEIGAYEGAVATVDAEGLAPDYEEIIAAHEHDMKDVLREYFRREDTGREIEALWDSEEPYSWTFKTDIPHETFEIIEDGEPYCRGIVFRLVDAAKDAPT